MRTVLICHHDAPLDLHGLAGWMASFSDLAGIVVIEEGGGQLKGRLKREWRRSGTLGLIDVLAFRAYYSLSHARADGDWTRRECARLEQRYPAAAPRILTAASPNAPEVAVFLRDLAPDLMLARCKQLIKPAVFGIPRAGTFVLHPGICPEYRNAHGCFWALARRDLGRVGATLLRIDAGIDTGAVYGYYTYAIDEVAETHYRIQWRCVLDNLDAIAAKMIEIARGEAITVDTAGRTSAVWGQPWLSRYLYWKLAARWS